MAEIKFSIKTELKNTKIAIEYHLRIKNGKYKHSANNNVIFMEILESNLFLKYIMNANSINGIPQISGIPFNTTFQMAGSKNIEEQKANFRGNELFPILSSI